MSLNVPRNKIPRDNVSRDNVSRDNVPLDNFPRDNVPRDNCSSLQCPSQQCPSRQLFLATIIPLDNYSSVLLQMVFYKEDGPPDDQNQGNRGWLQMIIQMIWPPSCSSVPLQMVICKKDGPLDEQNFFGRMGLKLDTKTRIQIRDLQCLLGLVSNTIL